MDFDNQLTEKIIGAAIEVHRHLGPGLLESTYEEALCIELEAAGLKYQRQLAVPVIYKGRTIGDYRIDLRTLSSNLNHRTELNSHRDTDH